MYKGYSDLGARDSLPPGIPANDLYSKFQKAAHDPMHCMRTATDISAQIYHLGDTPIRIQMLSEMYSAIQTGTGMGMQTMDACLMDLVKTNKININTARSAAKVPENFLG